MKRQLTVKKENKQNSDDNLYQNDRCYLRNKVFLWFKNKKFEIRFQQELYENNQIFAKIMIITIFILNTTDLIYSESYLQTNFLYLYIVMMLLMIANFIVVNSTQLLLLIKILFFLSSIMLNIRFFHYFRANTACILQQTLVLWICGLTSSSWFSLPLYSSLNYFIIYYINQFLQISVYANTMLEVNRMQLNFVIILIAIVVYFILEQKQRSFWSHLDSYKRSEKSYLQLFEDTLTPVLIITLQQGKIEVMNQKAKHLFRGLQYKNLVQIIDQSQQDQFQKLLDECNLDSEEKQMRLWIRNQNLKVQQEQDEQKAPEGEKKHDLNKLDLALRKDAFNLFCNVDPDLYCFDASLKPFTWKNSRAFIVTLIDNNDINSYQQLNQYYFSLLELESTQVLGTVEKDYVKWNNLLGLNIIKESDLKNLSIFISQSHIVYNLIQFIQHINLTYFNPQSNVQDVFLIKNLIIFAVEVATVKSIDQLQQIKLTFEDSFPKDGSGDPRLIQLVFYTLLYIMMKDSHLKIEIKINCFLQEFVDQKYILKFDFTFAASNSHELIFLQAFEDHNKQNNFIPEISIDKELSYQALRLILQLIKKDGGLAQLNEIDKKNNQTFINFQFVLKLNPPHAAKCPNQQLENIIQNQNFLQNITQLNQPNLLNLTNARFQQSQNQYIWVPLKKEEAKDQKLKLKLNNQDKQIDQVPLAQKPIIRKPTLIQKTYKKEQNSQTLIANNMNPPCKEQIAGQGENLIPEIPNSPKDNATSYQKLPSKSKLVSGIQKKQTNLFNEEILMKQSSQQQLQQQQQQQQSIKQSPKKEDEYITDEIKKKMKKLIKQANNQLVKCVSKMICQLLSSQDDSLLGDKELNIIFKTEDISTCNQGLLIHQNSNKSREVQKNEPIIAMSEQEENEEEKKQNNFLNIPDKGYASEVVENKNHSSEQEDSEVNSDDGQNDRRIMGYSRSIYDDIYQSKLEKMLQKHIERIKKSCSEAINSMKGSNNIEDQKEDFEFEQLPVDLPLPPTTLASRQKTHKRKWVQKVNININYTRSILAVTEHKSNEQFVNVIKEYSNNRNVDECIIHENSKDGYKCYKKYLESGKQFGLILIDGKIDKNDQKKFISKIRQLENSNCVIKSYITLITNQSMSEDEQKSSNSQQQGKEINKTIGSPMTYEDLLEVDNQALDHQNQEKNILVSQISIGDSEDEIK